MPWKVPSEHWRLEKWETTEQWQDAHRCMTPESHPRSEQRYLLHPLPHAGWRFQAPPHCERAPVAADPILSCAGSCPQTR